MLNREIVSIYAADKNIHFSCYYTFFTSISAQGHFLYTFYARCNSTSYHFMFDRIHVSEKKMSLFPSKHFHAVWLLIYIWDRPLRWGVISELKIGFLCYFCSSGFWIFRFRSKKNDSVVFTLILILTLCSIRIFFSILSCATESNSNYKQKASNQLDCFV